MVVWVTDYKSYNGGNCIAWRFGNSIFVLETWAMWLGVATVSWLDYQHLDLL